MVLGAFDDGSRRTPCANLAETTAFGGFRTCSPQGTVVVVGEEGRPDRGGTGRSVTGGRAGWGEDGAGSAGGVGGTRPDRRPRRRVLSRHSGRGGRDPTGSGAGRRPGVPYLCRLLAGCAPAGDTGPMVAQAPSREEGRRGPADGETPVVDEHVALLPPQGPVPTPQRRSGADRPVRATRCRTGRRWSHPAGQSLPRRVKPATTQPAQAENSYRGSPADHRPRPGRRPR